MIIGIYKIHHKVSNSIYIGQSNDVEKRWKRHLLELKNMEHHNWVLQYLWDISCDKDFEFEVLEVFEKFDSPITQQKKLAERETFYINLYSQSKDMQCINLNFGGYVETSAAINESLRNDSDGKWHVKKELKEILAECKKIDEFIVTPRPEMVREKKYIDEKKVFISSLQKRYSGIRILNNIFKPSKLNSHKQVLAYFQREYDQKYGSIDKKIKVLKERKESLLLRIKALVAQLNDDISSSS